MGRLCIWTKSAFDKLDEIYGTADTTSSVKKGFKLPRNKMTNSDLARLINSDELQSVVNPPKAPTGNRKVLKKNPLKNFGAMVKLNPYAKAVKRTELLAQVGVVMVHVTCVHDVLQQEKSKEARAERLKAKRASRKPTKKVGKEFYKSMIQDAPYVGEDYEVFSTWLGTTQ